MTTAIDTNVFVALWDTEDSLHRPALAGLESVFREGSLVLSGAVYAELVAAPGRTEAFVDGFCEDTGIEVEWEVSESMWREAGRVYSRYIERRRRERGAGPRRILTDFVIGAHAWVSGYKLLTLDDRLYRAAFPRLGVVKV